MTIMPEMSSRLSEIRGETEAWLRGAGALCDETRGSPQDFLEAIERGIALRRQWDRLLPEDPLRLDLLRSLTGLQSQWAEISSGTEGLLVGKLSSRPSFEGIEQSPGNTVAPTTPSGEVDSPPGSPGAEQPTDDSVNLDQLWDHYLEVQIQGSDRYLASLLAAPQEESLYALEAFRDDLNWLSVLVETHRGNSGPDLLSRILAEHETLTANLRDGQELKSRAQRNESVNATRDAESSDDRLQNLRVEAREISRQLQRDVLRRQAQLLEDCEPADSTEEALQRWQTASTLSTALAGLDMPGEVHESPNIRGTACQNWREQVQRLPEQESREAIFAAADQWMDIASETITFIEEHAADQAVRSLECLSEDLEVCLESVEHLGKSNSSPADDQKEVRLYRRRLLRQRKSVRGELQDRRLLLGMRRWLGPRGVVWFEAFMFAVLIFFTVLVAADAWISHLVAKSSGTVALPAGLSQPTLGDQSSPPRPGAALFAWLDLAVCGVFFSEFAFKWFLAREKWLYWKRYWLTGLVPALPVGFLEYSSRWILASETGGMLVAARALRYLRLQRLTMWLRAARPLAQAVRLLSLLFRAGDRSVRVLAPVLNRNLVFFENPADQTEEARHRVELAGLRERYIYRVAETQFSRPWDEQLARVLFRLRDLSTMAAAPHVYLGRAAKVDAAAGREVPVESAIARLVTATPASVAEHFGVQAAQSIVRTCGVFDLPGLRRLPGVRDLVESLRLASPLEAAAAAANCVGGWCHWLADRTYWVTDLHGTLTAPQLVDSIGSWLVKSTARPAMRLLVLGSGALVLFSLTALIPVGAVEEASNSMQKLVGTPLIVLGGICLIPLSLGIWMRRIAGEASEFYDHVAEAHFLAATKHVKRRYAEPCRTTYLRRVSLRDDQRSSPLTAASPDDSADGGAPPAHAARVNFENYLMRLWEDYLDSAPFHESDTKTTNHLLGNLALHGIRRTRLGLRRSELRSLRRLRLDPTQAKWWGPNLWFRCLSTSLAQNTAKLIIDYNLHAIPLQQLPRVTPEQRRKYDQWLAKRLHSDEDSPDLSTATGEAKGRREPVEIPLQGHAFTALNFLSKDPDLDRLVQQQFGDTALEALRRDRCRNIRRVFGTYPVHRLRKEHRTWNPFVAYQRHLRGGRILWLPAKLLWWSAAALWRLIRAAMRVVQEVRQPAVREDSGAARVSSFRIARRKLHRMRKPVFVECLKLRAAFDPEYLGVAFPGGLEGAGTVDTASGSATSYPLYLHDLEAIGPNRSIHKRLRDQESLIREQMRDLQELLSRCEIRLRDERARQAVALAYMTNHRGLREDLEAWAVVDAIVEAHADGQYPLTRRRAGKLRSRVARHRFRRLLEDGKFGSFDADQIQRWLRVTDFADSRLRSAVKRLSRDRFNTRHESWLALWRERILALATDSEIWSEQLRTLRAIQTLTVIDLHVYRNLIQDLGEYGETRSPRQRIPPGGIPSHGDDSSQGALPQNLVQLDATSARGL